MCITCVNSEQRRKDEDNTLQTFCKKENRFVFKGGYCHEMEVKQCTLCVNKKLDAQSFPCILCADLPRKPYFGILIEE